MEQFYTDYVYDYGVILQDLVAKKIPNTSGVLAHLYWVLITLKLFR
jgi:hypothetical protein